MTMRVAGSSVTAVVLAVVALSLPALGQQEPTASKGKGTAKAAAKSAPTPPIADGKVDLSGLWSAEPHFITDLNNALKPGQSLPLQPWAAKLVRERLADPPAHCLPTGVPRQNPHPWRIAQGPTHTFFLIEGNIHSYRQIFMDGRPHPEDSDPTWYGHSVANLEGDTLVVDSVGFNDLFGLTSPATRTPKNCTSLNGFSGRISIIWSTKPQLTIRGLIPAVYTVRTLDLHVRDGS